MKKYILILCASILLASCSQKNNLPQNPAIHVDTETIHPYNVPYILNYPGVVQGIVDYPVIPRVSGEIFKQFYTEGTLVKQGQALYQIDPKPFELALKNYQGQLIKDSSARDNYKLIYERYKALYALNAVSQQDLQTAKINYAAAVGNVQTDQANIDSAKLNIVYSLVRAPADGYISERQVTVGDMVTAFQTVLNHINSVSQMYILFSMPEIQRVEIENGALNHTISIPKNYTFRIDVKLADGKIIPDCGYVEFTDTKVSLANGAWSMRAYIDNNLLRNKLLSGQFVDVYIHGINYINAFAVPQQAVFQSNQGSFIYVVNNGKAYRRYITTGKMINDLWLIPSGLKDGDQIVSSGGINLSESAPVIIDNHIDSTTTELHDNSTQTNANGIQVEEKEVQKINASNTKNPNPTKKNSSKMRIN